MATFLTGIGIRCIAEITKRISKKTKKKISTRIVVGIISILAGTVYYAINSTHPELWNEIVTFVSGAFAMSQVIRLVVDKAVPNKDKK